MRISIGLMLQNLHVTGTSVQDLQGRERREERSTEVLLKAIEKLREEIRSTAGTPLSKPGEEKSKRRRQSAPEVGRHVTPYF